MTKNRRVRALAVPALTGRIPLKLQFVGGNWTIPRLITKLVTKWEKDILRQFGTGMKTMLFRSSLGKAVVVEDTIGGCNRLNGVGCADIQRKSRLGVLINRLSDPLDTDSLVQTIVKEESTNACTIPATGPFEKGVDVPIMSLRMRNPVVPELVKILTVKITVRSSRIVVTSPVIPSQDVINILKERDYVSFKLWNSIGRSGEKTIPSPAPIVSLVMITNG